MNVVDSSAWIEYFADGPNAGFFAAAVEDTADLVVPTLCLYEVFKRILQQRGSSCRKWQQHRMVQYSIRERGG